ncbi:PREDICTED: uncharacterized protein LOC106742288 [Dinoponera quadriceps]|uniref:Uncharacterized protein LOC106742288 n=1 Tax=Dinoponera quadriceps TaxID=609295 RepID=A0A6P3WXC9_DINQU|nr:PREDICTED: uncharacterized protein LOC106742288 [Dinoponera quadriceps]
MHYRRKLCSLRRLEKRKERTLHVRFPHTIKDWKDVENLFSGSFFVKLPRQASRSCYVVFSSMEEKIMNQKLVKNKTINDKRILVQSLYSTVVADKNKVIKKPKKKVFMPKIRPEIKVTQTIFAANIEIGTKADEIKGAIPGCVSVTLLKPYNNKFRSAIVKMENIQIAAEYLKKRCKWPILRGHKISLKPDTRTKHKRKSPADTLKIYNDATEESVKEEFESREKHKSSDREQRTENVQRTYRERCTEDDDEDN